MAEKDYIDRERLFNALNAYNTKFNAEINSIILSIPKENVQEVRHGKWIEQLDGTHYCSFCGRDATYTFDGNEVCGVTCTYCGTTMERSEQE